MEHQLAPQNSSPLLKHNHSTNSSSLRSLQQTSKGLGKPMKQTAINAIDLIAIAVVLICAAAAVLVISPSLSIAASLQFNNQIIVIGLLLSIMQICQQRIFQRLLLALEVRSMKSTIHNFDGLLRWSLFSRHFAWTWRIAIFTLMALPLVLSVMYKRFIGGFSVKTSHTVAPGVYRPGSLQGVPYAGPVLTFVNKTNAFLVASSDDSSLPPISDYPKAYGSSLLLISNGTAASLDEPINVVEMQRSLPANSALYFSADVQGTVSVYNTSADTHRSDPAFWASLAGAGQVPQPINGYPSCQFGLNVMDGGVVNTDLGQTNSSDQSYLTLGGFPGVVNNFIPDFTEEYQLYALLFNTLRYPCRGQWRLTPSTFDLVNGNCSQEPLPLALQYTKNAGFDMYRTFIATLTEVLGPFAPCGTRRNSPWYRSSAAATLVAAYSAMLGSTVLPIGPIFNSSSYDPPIAYNLTTQDFLTGGIPLVNTSYTVYDMSYQPENVRIALQVPTLHASWGLYVVVLVQPLLVILGYTALLFLHDTPISGGFGLVSILAGVDTSSLDILRGASFSGEVVEEVGMAVSVLGGVEDGDGLRNRIRYTVGRTGSSGRIQKGVLYD